MTENQRRALREAVNRPWWQINWPAVAAITNGAVGAEVPTYADRAVEFFDELLDAWELAAKAEDEDVYIPAEWEDEMVEFVTDWIAGNTL